MNAAIDTSALPFPKGEVRKQNQRHLAWIRTLRCCVPGCGRMMQIHAHHLLSSPMPKARGLKPDSKWTIPLCLYCHTALHAMGDEREWARRNNLDVVATAAEYWRLSPANKGGSP